MISVKKQGPYEVFSRGVEEPWVIRRDGQPYREAWTWEEVDEILRGVKPPKPTKKPRASHATKLDPKEQLVELFMQRTPEAGQIARDLLLEHGVIRSGRVDSVRTIGDSFAGPVFQIGVATQTGGRLGENDPKRYWMAGPHAPAVGSIVDFMVTDAYPPTGKSAFAPKHQLHTIEVDSFRRGTLPESVIRKWIATWWPLAK